MRVVQVPCALTIVVCRKMAALGFPLVMTDGGDDRCTLNAKGVNKYHCRPSPVKGALFRGSCTCNLPTERAYHAADAAFNALSREDVTVGDIFDGIRSSIKSSYNLPPGTEVFLKSKLDGAPLRTDARYQLRVRGRIGPCVCDCATSKCLCWPNCIAELQQVRVHSLGSPGGKQDPQFLHRSGSHSRPDAQHGQAFVWQPLVQLQPVNLFPQLIEHVHSFVQKCPFFTQAQFSAVHGPSW